ncbi:MAG TPA: RNA polymerase factor sigma-54 [Bacteroidales bacterium]|nr:RNA polymerase factor sigma-54 [Bacteroidales bacterium]HPI85443.1 RNA polymerase factor sigma-54 [Bacteroidales bacterium]HPM91507.1 RNA polymerase factor sigma-54 [Bacteroidales bacterium]
MLNQRLQQKLLQKLSPQQILLMKLLQIPTIALEQRIKQEIEENPALDMPEDGLDNKDDDDFGDVDDGPLGDDDDAETDEFKDKSPEDEFDFNDYLDEGDIPDYRLTVNNQSPDEEQRDIPFAAGTSFQEFLTAQLGLRDVTEKQYQIGLTIIGNLDDAGYLQRDITAMTDDMAFSQNMQVTREEILEVLKVIQDLDPPGVGARNLQECLLLQLRRKEDHHPDIETAILILERYFDEFTRKHYEKILKKTRITEPSLKGAIQEILKLNPKPGDSISETTRQNQYVIPDFSVRNIDGELELTVNSRNAPELRISRTYLDMMETYAGNKHSKGKEAMMFVKQKIDSAKWFIDAIKQRQNTLYVTMKAIMDYQEDYFRTGDETTLRPMILKDIAEKVNLDISTISRVANSKYVETPFGTFLLKTFFSESMQKESGEEVSTREIKKILSDFINAEEKGKPLTDEQLTEILKDKGYNIARRTVAKYREQLNIPVARLRKEL